MATLEHTSQVIHQQVSVDGRGSTDEFDELDILFVDFAHLLPLLPDAEHLLQDEEDELSLIFLGHLAIHLLLLRVSWGPVEGGDSRRRLS